MFGTLSDEYISVELINKNEYFFHISQLLTLVAQITDSGGVKKNYVEPLRQITSRLRDLI